MSQCGFRRNTNCHLYPSRVRSRYGRRSSTAFRSCTVRIPSDVRDPLMDEVRGARTRPPWRTKWALTRLAMVGDSTYRMLPVHLTRYGLNKKASRDRFGLPRNYPMMCAACSDQRSTRARSVGLGLPIQKPDIRAKAAAHETAKRDAGAAKTAKSQRRDTHLSEVVTVRSQRQLHLHRSRHQDCRAHGCASYATGCRAVCHGPARELARFNRGGDVQKVILGNRN